MRSKSKPVTQELCHHEDASLASSVWFKDNTSVAIKNMTNYDNSTFSSYNDCMMPEMHEENEGKLVVSRYHSMYRGPEDGGV